LILSQLEFPREKHLKIITVLPLGVILVEIHNQLMQFLLVTKQVRIFKVYFLRLLEHKPDLTDKVHMLLQLEDQVL